MHPIDKLKSVLCDPEGKASNAGSAEDARVINEALAELSAKPGDLAVANLIDATENLMAWQVRNVKIWNNSAYDNAALRLQQLRDVQPLEPEIDKLTGATK